MGNYLDGKGASRPLEVRPARALAGARMWETGETLDGCGVAVPAGLVAEINDSADVNIRARSATNPSLHPAFR
jgi:hypothetical protein